MAKPPPSTPHSDIDGVHQDERKNTDVARELGQGAGDLDRAEEGNAARPDRSDDVTNREDRTG